MNPKQLKSFQISNNHQLLDYRLPGPLDPTQVKAYFLKKGCTQIKLTAFLRHLTGQLNHPRFGRVFLKLSTSPGMDITTQNEYEFYQAVANQGYSFCPVPYTSGRVGERYYYIAEFLPGQLLVSSPGAQADTSLLEMHLNTILSLSTSISQLSPWQGRLDRLTPNPDKAFTLKWQTWYADLPQKIILRYNLARVKNLILTLTSSLLTTPRHGDFAPWHLMLLPDQTVKVIDAEHALSVSPAGYDLAFLIQRVYSVLQKPQLAEQIYSKTLIDPILQTSFQICLLARALGGFLDESLTAKPDYTLHVNYLNWVHRLLK